MQVLTYMWTGVKVNGVDVVSIFLGESALKLRHSPATIQAAIRSLDWGLASDSKDFLDPITPKTGTRKRAANIYLSKLPQALQDDIKKGIYLLSK